MKITLVSTYASIASYGLRILSAVLKEAGFETRMIFMPRDTEGLPWNGFCYPYSDAVLDQLAELSGDSGLVGVSLSTNYFFNAVQITQRLRRSTNAPLVWGGIHPTVRPQECLDHADLVCVGEGEEAVVELAQRLAGGEGCQGIDNMWYRDKGHVVCTPLRPLQANLDVYPYPDYELESSWILHQGRIRPMTLELWLQYARWPGGADCVPAYETMLTRGCAFRCAYCCNDALRSIYPGQWRVRRRSVGHLMGELKRATAYLPGLGLIRFVDDDFVDDLDTLHQFCTAYKQTVAIPFEVDGWRPDMVDHEKISLLVDVGLKILHMGIQTGSMRTMHHIYRRPLQRHHVIQATQVLSQFAGRIDPPVYDLIVDNPWEDEQDQLETLSLLLDIPRPYRLQLFSLTFYPGTELYERGKREGLIQDESSQIYQKHYFLNSQRTYLNGLFKLIQSQRAPRWLLVFLMHERLRRLQWVWLPFALNSLLHGIQLVAAGWRAARRGDWKSISRYLHLTLGRHPKAYQSLA
jgi:anaerobic magnesium-protoporphyrin IX monomethyl ester cyclase